MGRKPASRTSGGSMGTGSCIDAPPPRLTTKRAERKAQELRDELAGKRKPVTLPKLRFLEDE